MTTEQSTEERALSRVYEVAYLLSPNIPEDKVAESVGRLKNILEKRGVFVLSDEFPKFRQLAYTLVKPLGGHNEKYSNAYFGWVKFESAADLLADIKADFEAEASLIRFLIVKADREIKTSERAPLWRKETVKREVPKAEGKTLSGMTEAEMDKTIEELVVE